LSTGETGIGENSPVVDVFEPEPIGVSDAQELIKYDGGEERSNAVRCCLQQTGWIRVDVLHAVVVHCTKSRYRLRTTNTVSARRIQISLRATPGEYRRKHALKFTRTFRNDEIASKSSKYNTNKKPCRRKDSRAYCLTAISDCCYIASPAVFEIFIGL